MNRVSVVWLARMATSSTCPSSFSARCNPAASQPRLPDVLDPYQAAIRWVNLHHLDTVPLIPPGMQEKVIAALEVLDDFDPFTQHS